MTSQEKKLIELYQTLTNGAEKELKPGMLAKWKPDMKNRKFPQYNEAVVVTKYDSMIFDDKSECDSSFFMEKLDIVLGFVIGEDGYFLEYHFDSRRFMPFHAEPTEGDQP